MERVCDPLIAEAVARARRHLSRPLRELIAEADVLCGVDPLFVGLHSNEIAGANKDEPGAGRSYRDTAHVSMPWNGNDPRSPVTVVLPDADDRNPNVVLHEFGHVLDRVIATRLGRPYLISDELELPALNDYAATCATEAFAVAFTNSLAGSRRVAAFPGWYGEQMDRDTRDFFRALRLDPVAAVARRVV